MSSLTAAKTPSKAGSRKRRWLSAVAALALLPSALAAPLPAMAQPGGPRISIIRDTEIEEIIHKQGEPIWRAAGLNPDNVHIVIMGDPDINAFTAGGQTIFVNTGFLQATKNPNQMLGVLAHETGHITGGHVARESMYKPALATYLLTMGLGILAAVAGAPDAGAGLLYSSDYFATLTALTYSRQQEAAADMAGAGFLEKAHLSGRGLVDFFDYFRYQEAFSDARKYRFFIDHPLTEERIASLQDKVQKSPYYNVVDGPQALAEHAIMVAKLKAFMNAPQQTFIDYKETDASFPARYARAIAYYRALETDKALKLTQALIDDYPNNPYLYELKGQILFEAGKPKDAADNLTKAVALKPKAPLLQVMLGQELLAEEDKTKVDDAIAHLQKALELENDNVEAYFTLAQAWAAKGDEGRARLYTAEQNFYLGQMKDARAFAMRARETLAKDSPDYRRATDIVLASQPTPDEMKAMARQGG
ncbi:MAG TPA: M48 family metalloprotease [Caulobacteraceae bacterium]|jgi:predicted Zn-dependent protease